MVKGNGNLIARISYLFSVSKQREAQAVLFSDATLKYAGCSTKTPWTQRLASTQTGVEHAAATNGFRLM